MNKRFARFFTLSLVVMLATGCATASLTQTATPAQSAAIALLEQGKPREAAQQLEAQAATASGAQRSRLLADAAFAWNEAGDAARARSLLAQVTPRQLAGDERGRYQLLSAEFALADKQPAQALQL
ncbi:MAG TPA: penicillin-binding protein activator, partial [Stenotrophomonas sp.]